MRSIAALALALALALSPLFLSTAALANNDADPPPSVEAVSRSARSMSARMSAEVDRTLEFGKGQAGPPGAILVRANRLEGLFLTRMFDGKTSMLPKTDWLRGEAWTKTPTGEEQRHRRDVNITGPTGRPSKITVEDSVITLGKTLVGTSRTIEEERKPLGLRVVTEKTTEWRGDVRQVVSDTRTVYAGRYRLFRSGR
jgi:hypothetical protein